MSDEVIFLDDLGVQGDGEPVKAGVEDPAAAPEPKPEEQPTDQPTEEPKSEEPAPEEDRPHKKGGYQRKIERLERQLEQALSIVSRVAPNAVPEPQEPAPQDAGKPRPDDFESHEQWVEALTDWKTEQRERDRARDEEQRRSQDLQNQIQSTFQERYQAASKAHPDFEDLFEERAESIPTSPVMQQAVIESELGAELMYHFLKNPNDAARIAALPPVKAAIEIGKLEAKLATPEPPKPKPTSQAPKPPAPVRAPAAAPPKGDGDMEWY